MNDISVDLLTRPDTFRHVPTRPMDYDDLPAL